MKSKAAVYVLGFLVLCIWGVIVYRIYLSVHDQTSDDNGLKKATVIKKINVPKLYPDTFRLLVNYPDPFTGDAVKIPDTALGKTRKSIQPGLLAPLVQVINPVMQMKYLGFVADGKGGNRVAIISYQGAEKMLKESDTLQKVRVMSIKKNGVILQYKGKTTMIKID